MPPQQVQALPLPLLLLLLLFSRDTAAAATYAAVRSFSTYPGYSGTLHVGGTMSVVGFPDGAASTSTIIRWDLTGVDPACQGTETGNSCGIHVHAGTSCADAGGHLLAPSVRGDPWAAVHYQTIAGASTSKEPSGADPGYDVATGLTLDQVIGHAMVVHDHAGARIACGIVAREDPPKPTTYAEVKSWVKYPGSTTPLRVAGTVALRPGTGSTPSEVLTWDLTGVDPACPTGTGNVCGIHIHVGISCTNAASIGGHLAAAAVTASGKDPWTAVRYSGTKGASESPDGGVEVVTGLPLDEVVGHVMVVHDSAGAGERIACGVIIPAHDPTLVVSVKWHGCLMVLAWVVCLIPGAVVARQRTQLGLESAAASGVEQWFTLHQILQSVGFIVFTAGLVAILIHEERIDFEHYHEISGWVVVVIAIAQMALGVRRPAKDSPARAKWLLAHQVCGALSIALSLFCLLTGISATTPGAAFWGFLVVVVAFVALFVASEKAGRTARGAAGESLLESAAGTDASPLKQAGLSKRSLRAAYTALDGVAAVVALVGVTAFGHHHIHGEFF